MAKREISLEEVKKIIDDFFVEKKDFLSSVDFVIGVSRGGLAPAALLAAEMDKPLVTAYINKSDEIFFDRAEWIKGKNVLAVDDIIRSGRTLWLLKKYLAENSSPKSLSFFTLLKVKPLENKIYDVGAFSREIDEDVLFPWDCDRR
jgi:hypoxanthine phosphoribosyltransferase